MEQVRNFLESVGRIIPIIIVSVLTVVGGIFIEHKINKSKTLETERLYFDLDSNELVNLFLDISMLSNEAHRLNKIDLQVLYDIMQTFRVWCLDLRHVNTKFNLSNAINQLINEFESNYAYSIDINHSMEYVELNVVNVIQKISKLKINN